MGWVSNDSEYEGRGIRGCGSGVGCSVVVWVKRSTLRWFDYIERIENEEFVTMHLSSVEGPTRRGRPLGRLEERVKEYVRGGVRGNGLEWVRRECTDRERWRSVCRGHSIRGHFWREQGAGSID